MFVSSRITDEQLKLVVKLLIFLDDGKQEDGTIINHIVEQTTVRYETAQVMTVYETYSAAEEASICPRSYLTKKYRIVFEVNFENKDMNENQYRIFRT